jgi:hypothetical protein
MFTDYNNNQNKEEEDIVDDTDLNDPYEMSILSLQPTQNSVCLFTDMIEWLKSDFEDDPVVDTKVKSTAATASAMIRKDKQMASITTATATATTTNTVNQSETTTTDATYTLDTQTENSSVLDAMEQLAVIDDAASSMGTVPSQESWDNLDDLIDQI